MDRVNPERNDNLDEESRLDMRVLSDSNVAPDLENPREKLPDRWR